MSAKTPCELGFAMPAESARHERTLMAWPCRFAAWGDGARKQRAKAAHAGLAGAIAEFEPVLMVAKPEDAGEAERLCGKRIEIAAIPIDDSWMRDSGPIFVTGAGEVAGVDWGFNAWGEKYKGFDKDDALPAHILSRFKLRRFAGPMVLEGGAINVDGAGTLITTEECLLNPNRNPRMPREEVEAHLSAYLGVKQIIWLPFGLDDDETDGHVDNVAAFAGEGRILLHYTNDARDPMSQRCKTNEHALAGASDARGRKIEIIRMPAPRREIGWNGRKLPASYLNFYVANGAVFAPSFGDPLDAEAKRILIACFQDREIVQVPANDIIPGGGGIHCITQQQPAVEGLAR